MGTTSAGSIQLDLEVEAKLEEGAQKEAEKIVKAIKAQLGSMKENMFASLSKSVENAMKSMTDAIKKQTDVSKKIMQMFINDMQKMVKNMKFVSPVLPNTEIPQANTKEAVINPSSPRAPPVSPSIPKPKIKLDDQFSTEMAQQRIRELEHSIENLSANLDILNQKRKQLLQESLEAEILNDKKAISQLDTSLKKIDLSISATIDKIDNFKITLDALKRKQNQTSESARSMANEEQTVGRTTNSLTKQIRLLNSAFKSKLSGIFHRNIENVHKSTKKASQSTGSYHMSLKRLISSFLIFSMIFPLVSRGIMALMSSLGQSLMANEQFANSFVQIRSNLMTAFMPIYSAILPALNAMMSALAKATAYIASFVSALFGTTYKASFKAAQGLVAAKDAMGAYGSSAKQAAKDAKDAMSSTLGIDELNVLEPQKDTSSDGGGGASAPAMTETPLSETEVSGMNEMASKVKSILSDIFKPFKDSWNKYGPGIMANVKDAFMNIAYIVQDAGRIIGENWYSTMRPLSDLILGLHTTSSLVFKGISILLKSAWDNGGAYLFDQVLKLIGNIARLGSLFLDTFINPWLEGINSNLMPAIGKLLGSGLKQIGQWIEKLNSKIIEFIDNFDMTKATDDLDTLKEKFLNSFGIIAGVLSGICAVMLSLPVLKVIDWFKNFSVVSSNLGILNTVMLGLKSTFFGVSTALSALSLPVIACIAVIASLAAGFTYLYITCDDFRNKINTIFVDMATNIQGIITGIISIIMTLYEVGIKPFIESTMQAFDDLWNNGLSVFVQNVSVFVLNLIDMIMSIWNNAVNPFIELLLNIFLPMFTMVWDAILAVAIPIIKKIMQFINMFMEVLNVLMALLNEHVWPIFKVVFDGLSEIVQAFWNFISPIFKWFMNLLSEVVTFAINMFAGPLEVIFGTVVQIIKDIADPIAKVFDGIKQTFQGIIDFVVGIFTGDWSRAWDGVKGIFEGIWNTLSGIVETVWNTILSLFSNAGSIFSGVVDGIASAFRNIVNCIIDGINKVIAFPFNKINGLLNNIRETSFLGITPFDFIPYNVLPVPQIPKLAQGGYVGANQPQLAMIGDNKRYGEIVAPEDKLFKIMNAALDAHQGQEMDTTIIEELLKMIIQILDDLDLVAEFDVDGFVRLLDRRKSRLNIGMMR